MKRILKKMYQLKLLNLDFNKINFPQSNPTLDTWEQKNPKPIPLQIPKHNLTTRTLQSISFEGFASKQALFLCLNNCK